MNKEIKFRAYIKHLKWVVPIVEIAFDCKTVEVDLTDGNGDTSEYGFDEVEIMQYTGLKDLNGKDICDKDIVMDIEGYKYVITWQESGWAVEAGEEFDWLCNIDAEQLEVIGNIFESPELLKEEQSC